MKIKEMPSMQRPDERALNYGTEVLSDAEVIAVILRTGMAGKSSLDLANEVLSIDKGKDGLANLMCCSIEDLTKICGLGPVKALKLACVFELCKRISNTKTTRNVLFDRPSKVADYYMEATRHLDVEEAHVLYTDTHNRLIKSELIAKGSINAAALSVREIIKKGLSLNAAGITLVHNHPSGVPEPSSEDIQFSKTLKEAARLMNLEFLDSVIIGDGDYLSMKLSGIL